MTGDVIEIAEYFARNSPNKLIREAVTKQETAEDITDLNLSQLEDLNEDSRGVKLADIGGKYTEFTQQKKGLGPRDVNLKDTGQYHESFKTIPISGGYLITSNPIVGTGDNLEARYGVNLEGLNTENIKLANELIEETIFKIAEEKI